MADEDLDLDVEGGGDGEAPKKSKKLLFIIIAAILIIIIGAVGGMFAMGLFDNETDEQTTEEGADTGGDGDKKAKKKDKEAEELAKDSIYWEIDPPFVMNFEGKSKAKYMQIAIVVMSRSQKAVDVLKKHGPAVRNELTFLLGSQKFVEMNTPEGKEQLRSEIIESINTIVKKNGVSAGIKNILFTSFVMQ